MDKRKIILASTSPRRHELMRLLGVPFEIVASDFEEDMKLKMPPAKLAAYLSAGKAAAVAQKHQDDLVIGADTIVAYKNQVFGKPKTLAEARKMLRTFSGNVHSVFTGFTIIDGRRGRIVSRSVETKLYFRKLSEREIDHYVNLRKPLDLAGAYAIQDQATLFIEKIEGNYYNIVGLPLFHIARELKKFGIVCI